MISRTRHVKSCLKMGEPSSKAKYSLSTDSGLVPWGKAEKYPGRGAKSAWNLLVTDVRGMEGDFFRLEILAIELKIWCSNHQCHAFRLETRAKELTVMASINCKSGCEGKPSSRSFARSQERRVKVRRVMAARLEASRSIPELDEGGRKPSGGLKTFWRANRCCDLGIGVKNQSRLALASSNRSVSQGVVCGDSVSGRALIERRGG